MRMQLLHAHSTTVLAQARPTMFCIRLVLFLEWILDSTSVHVLLSQQAWEGSPGHEGNSDCVSVFGIPSPSCLLPPRSLAIGPQAEELYREWRSPSHGNKRRAASQIKRSDPDRGLERVGRCDLVH